MNFDKFVYQVVYQKQRQIIEQVGQGRQGWFRLAHQFISGVEKLQNSENLSIIDKIQGLEDQIKKGKNSQNFMNEKIQLEKLNN
ncbi:unnamed protein product [Paramecium sonneborni]|uniref:Uncharacterized protein n=1 Tax=Paramecium sonneborni TaxID=65129 RepID=A0A8S1RMY3_9CILI|nr:unnamed protein product [Paramecium sonneborni]